MTSLTTIVPQIVRDLIRSVNRLVDILAPAVGVGGELHGQHRSGACAVVGKLLYRSYCILKRSYY